MQNKPSRRILRLFFLLLVVVIIICGCFDPNIGGLSNSSQVTRTEQKHQYNLSTSNDGMITDVTLISAFIDIINNNANTVDVYRAIPEKYRENVSLHDFTVYLNMMSSNLNYRVTEFARINDTKRDEYSNSITTDLPSLAVLAKETEFYQLTYGSENPSLDDYSIIIGIQHDEEGNFYLSDKWIANVNKLYEFSRLYFDAIDEQDADMLTWILTQGYGEPPADQMINIEKSKANLLIDYYRFNVNTAPEDSLPLILLPNKMTFIQILEIQKPGEESNAIRSCSFSQKNNIISVSDPYPEVIKSMHLNVYYQDRFLLSWSSNGIRQTYYNYHFNEILGEPNIVRTSLASSSESDDNFWRITYPEISFIVRGNADSDTKTWSGILERIEINEKSTNISLGEPKNSENSIYIGMPLYDFYNQYPFSPEADYTISGNQLNEEMEMVVEVDNEKVQSLILRSVY